MSPDVVKVGWKSEREGRLFGIRSNAARGRRTGFLNTQRDGKHEPREGETIGVEKNGGRTTKKKEERK